uniref:Uncharacterized protein n=1 Tax=Fagus sylvatica TaxID=28930 RepID=A0A2N9G8Z9_FAGSY
MASFSRKSARRRRKTFFGEGDPPISGEAATPRGGEDDGGSSSPGSEPTRPVDEEILAIPLSFDFHCSRAAGWLSVFSPGRLQFTAYCVHRVRRQFGFDQEIPAVMGVAAGKIPTINPFLKTRAFAYWSSVTSRVVIPSGNRVGIYTAAISNYWRDLMAATVEFRNNGRRDISHLLQAHVSPLPHPRLFAATNTMTTYANRQSSGYAVWR